MFALSSDRYVIDLPAHHTFPLQKYRLIREQLLAEGTLRPEEILGPGLVFYLAGVDPHEHDRLGRLRLTHAGLRQRDHLVLRACRDANIPVTITLGGGYGKDLEGTVEAHCNTVRAARAVFDGDF